MTAPDITLRRAGSGDATFMRDLARAAYAHYVERVGREPGPMVDDYDRRVSDDECWIASTDGADGGTDIGILVLRHETDHVVIDNVEVDPAVQGQGVGRLLLGFAEERASALGHREIRLYTHVTMVENLALYTRLGYVETHREDESGFNRVFMSKQLEA